MGSRSLPASLQLIAGAQHSQIGRSWKSVGLLVMSVSPTCVTGDEGSNLLSAHAGHIKGEWAQGVAKRMGVNYWENLSNSKVCWGRNGRWPPSLPRCPLPSKCESQAGGEDKASLMGTTRHCQDYQGTKSEVFQAEKKT